MPGIESSKVDLEILQKDSSDWNLDKNPQLKSEVEIDELISAMYASDPSSLGSRFGFRDDADPAEQNPARFFEKLILFIKNAPKDQRLSEFVASVHEKYFSFSPNLMNSLSMQDQLILMAESTRVPEIQGWFGQTMVGEFVYELSYCKPAVVSALLKAVLSKNTTAVLDVVHQLSTIGADAIAQGGWADPAVDRAKDILLSIKKKSKVPLIQYAVDISLERIAHEMENPTLGVITFTGNKAASRISESYSEKEKITSQKIERSIMPTGLSSRESYTFLPISSDMIGAFDHSKLLRSYARERAGSLVEGQDLPLPYLSIQNAIDFCETDSRASAGKIINYIRPLIEADADVEHSDVPSVWVAISSVLTESEWKEILTPKENSVTTDEKIYDKLEDGKLNLYKDIVTYLRKKEAVFRQTHTVVPFSPYEEISNDRNLSPFANLPEDTALLLQHLHQPEMRRRLEKDFGIELEAMPFRYQVHFLRMLAEKDNASYDRLVGFIKKHEVVRRDIIVSYLSCAEDSDNESLIFNLEKKFSSESFEKIISTYAQIVGQAEDLRAELEKNFASSRDYTEEQVLTITKSVIKKANAVLRELSQKAESEILPALQNLNVEQILFLNAFKALREEKMDLKLEDIKNAELKEVRGGELSTEEIAAMSKIYAENQKGNEAVQKELLEKFSERVQDSTTRFSVFTREGAIQGFLAFTPQENGEQYLSSVNIIPEARGYRLGDALLQEIVEKEAAKHVLTADCDSKLPISAKYIETGFVATRYFDDNGDKILDIRRDDKVKGNFWGKNKSFEEILDRAAPPGVRVENAAEQKDLPFELLNQGYVLTRMFKNPSGGVYAVFEPASKSFKNAQ